MYIYHFALIPVAIMKHILIILFSVLIPVCLAAGKESDSLINIVREYEKQAHFESNIDYIKALINISKSLKSENPDSSLIFSNKAYKLSAKYSYTKETLESALTMAAIYLLRNDSDMLLRIANEILPVAQEADKKSLSSVYNIFGAGYYCKGSSDKSYLYQALDVYTKSLKLSEELCDTTEIINTLSNLAAISAYLHNYTTALETLYRAISIAENSGRESSVGMYINVCNIYYEQQKYEQALIEIEKGLTLAEKINNDIYLGICLHLKGLIYYSQNKLEEALDCINRSMEIFQRMNLSEYIFKSKEVLSKIYKQKGLYKEALDIAYEVMKVWEEAGENENAFYLKSFIAELYYDQAQYSLALKTCNEILESECKDLITLNNKHQIMSMIYEAQNNGLKALEHYKQFKIYSDSLYHNNLDEQIINLEAQSKYEKKEMELKAEQALKEAEYIKDKAKLQLVTIFITVLFLSVFIFLMFILQSRKKLRTAYTKLEYANKEIQNQKEEILSQSEELRTTNEHLVKLIKFKQDISGMIVHDLKNPLSIMLGLTTSIPNKESLALLHNSAQRMLNLVLNILDINKYEDSRLELNYSNSDINDLIKSAEEDFNSVMKIRQLKFELNLEEDLNFSFDKDIIRRVLDNLLNNAVKFSPSNETIYISTAKEEGCIRVAVTNNGPEIPIEMQEKIFELYGRVDRKENDSHVNSTGLGLTFCKIALTAHNGTIGVESLPNKPIRFWFELPIKKLKF